MRVNTYQDGIRFSAIIQPRSSKNEVTGIYKGAIKIRLTSPPVDGAANKSCLHFFSKWLDVAPSKISITRGHSSKNKTIKVVGLSEKQFLEILKIKNLLK
tara:strand:- start:17 stop:316 length:300 start_codon:yes stop_codon:yes gene_type:complete